MTKVEVRIKAPLKTGTGQNRRPIHGTAIEAPRGVAHFDRVKICDGVRLSHGGALP